MGKGGAAFQDLNQQQTVAERRALRGEYRKLHSETIAGKENLINGEELQVKLQQLEALHRQVARPREHAVDAEVLAQLTECSLNMIKRGQAANQGRTPGDLIRALRVAFIYDPLMAGGTEDCEAFDWAALGAEASILHRTAPGVSCMLGPLAAEAKVRKAVVRQPKRAVEELTKPQELASIHEEEKQETDRNMENMWRQLRRLPAGQQVPLTHLVCNHNSFAQTVENIFTLSFLVRDQRVRLELHPESGLMVQTVSEAEKNEAIQQGRSQAQQFMMNMTMEDWRLMKLLVPADSCVMPHRAGHGTPSPQHAAAAAAGAGSARPPKRARRSS